MHVRQIFIYLSISHLFSHRRSHFEEFEGTKIYSTTKLPSPLTRHSRRSPREKRSFEEITLIRGRAFYAQNLSFTLPVLFHDRENAKGVGGRWIAPAISHRRNERKTARWVYHLRDEVLSLLISGQGRTSLIVYRAPRWDFILETRPF